MFVDDGFISSSNLIEVAPHLFVSNNDNGHVPTVSYPEKFFEENQADLSNFWIGRRNRNIEKILIEQGKTTILEVGSGHGAVARYLASRGFLVRCIEPQIAGALQTARCGISTLVSVKPMDHINANSQSAIGLFDVLEHVESDLALLKTMFDLLRPGGIVVVTVPTGNWLFSNTDVALGHYRRYSRKGLRQTMDQAGFNEIESSYLFTTLVVVAFILRALPYRLGIKARQNHLLEKVSEVLDSKSIASRLAGLASRLEEHFDRRRILPYGLSIIGVYRARDLSVED
jgi:2-polyprenyl-3-methyl-5-hydroxy-6-metoxy-1,4-benzoquinol methylase